MRTARWASMFLLVALTAAACTASAGAQDPPTQSPETEPTRTTGIATTAPNFGLPTPSLATPTRTAGSTATSVPQPTATRERVVTATPGRTPEATQAPADSPTATAQPATATATPPVVSSPGEPYSPILQHSYTVPAGWQKSFTQSSTVVTDPSGKIKVTIKETLVERWRYPAVSVLGTSQFPDRPSSWSQWSSTASGAIKNGQAYEFQFVGSKGGVDYLQFVHWYLWGDVKVELSAEVPSFDWASSTSVRSNLQSVLESFVPHNGDALLTAEEVLDLLYVRLDNRPSGIYVRDEVIRGRVELTCREIYETLLGEPFYAGNGTWQASAYTMEGVETWWVFEPTGTIMAVDSNGSRC